MDEVQNAYNLLAHGPCKDGPASATCPNGAQKEHECPYRGTPCPCCSDCEQYCLNYVQEREEEWRREEERQYWRRREEEEQSGQGY